jgi:hypothetical protein
MQKSGPLAELWFSRADNQRKVGDTVLLAKDSPQNGCWLLGYRVADILKGPGSPRWQSVKTCLRAAILISKKALMKKMETP